MEQKEVALSVSKAILNGEWEKYYESFRAFQLCWQIVFLQSDYQYQLSFNFTA